MGTIRSNFSWLLPAMSGFLAFVVAFLCFAAPARATTQTVSGTIYPSLTKFQTFRYKSPTVGVWIDPNTSDRRANPYYGYQDGLSFDGSCYWSLGLRKRSGIQASRLQFNQNNPPKTLFPDTMANSTAYDFAFNGKIQESCWFAFDSAKFTGTLTF